MSKFELNRCVLQTDELKLNRTCMLKTGRKDRKRDSIRGASPLRFDPETSEIRSRVGPIGLPTNLIGNMSETK